MKGQRVTGPNQTGRVLLAAIGRYGCLSAPQLSRLCYPSALSHVQKAVALLQREGYVTSYGFTRHDHRRGGSGLSVYVLARKGSIYLKRAGQEVILQPSIRESGPLAHSHSVNDLLILCNKSGQVEWFLTEFELKRLPVRIEDVTVIPDAFTLLADYPIIWEVDRGTEYRQALRKHVHSRLLYANGEYRRALDVDGISVAYVTTTPSRVEQMVSWCEAEIETMEYQALAPNFFFAAFDPEKADPTIFHQSVWHSPFSNQAVRLIE